MLITPQLAQQWLERNTRNRPLSDNTVIAYGLDMLEGRWQYDGAPIRFDTGGNLIDGQHRLKACIESGVSFENDVIFDLPPEAMRTIDIHRPRTAGHIAHIEGAQNASCACAVAGLIVLHRRHGKCRAIQERFQEYRAASIQKAHAAKIAEFRQIAHQLHEQGTDLCVNRVLTRMSVPKSLEHRIARGLLTEIKREILANGDSGVDDPPPSHERDRLQLQ